MSKYKLSDDLKAECIAMVHGYDRRVALYHERRSFTTWDNTIVDVDDELQRIEELADTRMMRAVEQAKFLVGVDLEESQRQRLATAIWDSCILGRYFTFDSYDLSADKIAKTAFFKLRAKFLWDIARFMEFLTEAQLKAGACNVT